MNIDLTGTWQEAQNADLHGRTAIVIDILRATTSIVTAFSTGANTVYPVADVEEARRLSEELGEQALLCGERGGVKLPGFDLGNSPREYTRDRVAGRSIVMTTTNGTNAVKTARTAAAILLCSLGNIGAVSRQVADDDCDITIICAGTEGRLSKDDLFCGGMLIASLVAPGHVRELSDGARIGMEWYLSRAGRAEYVLRSSQHGQRLVALGFEDDLPVCAQIDTCSQVPVWNGSGFTVSHQTT